MLVSLRRDLLHLLLLQRELGQSLEVALQPLLLGAGCERDNSLVKDPSEADVRVGNAVLFRQPLVDGHHRATLNPGNRDQGTVRSNSDVVLLVEGDEVAVLEVRMVLDLVDRGRDLCRLEDGLEMLLEEVGDANGLCAAGSLDGLEVGPLLLQLLVAVGEEGAVDEVQVDVVQAELLQREDECLFGVLLVRGADLGGDEELFAGNA